MTPGFGAGLVIPDLWQQEAVRALQQGKDVVVQAPTGSGKTYIFELLYPNLKTQSVFTVPTRALANDKLSEWRARGWDVGISTGDVALNLDAKVVVATLETQRGRFLRFFAPAHDRELPRKDTCENANSNAALRSLTHRKRLTMDQIPLPEL
jgi:superfamily II DNA or RNA helicase